MKTFSHPLRGTALFRWILEQRKGEQKPLDENQKEALAKLREQNAHRGTPVV
ncbi:hypothetical protein [Larkinella sp.]|uniref:hypothetical protein n=1 Tax=Larkinella sp. TaxID=2034517 RepID=UPI003BAD9A2C